jgi:hypothetical protein
MLTRFWFKFGRSTEPSILDLGCGITAYDLKDAQAFLREKVFPIYGDQPVLEVVPNVDVRNLEERHVRPNMGNPAVRGVWFPLI